MPPVPVVQGAAVSHEELVLESTDGTRFAAFAAVPDEPTGAGIVVLPDVRGLYRFYEELALRFGERGLTAVAIDYFGRTAGATARDDEFEYMPHVQQVDPANVRADVAAAIERLRANTGAGPVFTVGFCFGGSQSWRLSATDLNLAGVIGFYGRPVMVNDVIDQMHIPMLLQIAGADMATPPEEFAEFERKLTAQGVEHDMKVYEGAPHSFFDRRQEAYQSESQDAWERILGFVSKLQAEA